MSRSRPMSTMPRILALLCLFSLSLSPIQPGAASSFAASSAAPAAPTAPTDVPDALYQGDLSRYTVEYPVVYTYTGTPPCPPAALGDGDAGAASEGDAEAAAPDGPSESIGRTPAYGGAERLIWSRASLCNHNEVLSNIETDGQYLYWMSSSQGGLVRLSKDANPGDVPTLITTQVTGAASLDYYFGQLYILKEGVSPLWAVDTTTLAFTREIVLACFNCGKLTVTIDNFYWMDGGSLMKFKRDTREFVVVKEGVGDYYARDFNVWYTTGSSVVIYVPWLEQHNPVYYSADPAAGVYEVTISGDYLFLIEQRPLGCAPFPCYQYLVVRDRWDGDGPSEELYVTRTEFPHSLSAGGGFVFWQEPGRVNRLAENAAALPKINLRPTSIEVTQAIQNMSNSVGLVAGKRTFARVTAVADGANVPGVTALLYRTDSGGTIIDGPLNPVNSVGPRITVPTTADRNNINRSFLFELPWSWLSGELHLKAQINPMKIPLEPNYGDNQIQVGPLNFRTSPRLPVQFVGFGYDLNNTTYYPHFRNDVVLTYSYIRRTYPLSSAPGFISDPSPGFRPNLWLVFDDGLGSRVNQTAPECASLGNLCASAYANGRLTTMRTEEGLDSSIFMYGMISDRGGFFPRGQEGGSSVSSGPAGPPNTANGNFLGGGWDLDLTYGDWYAAHEIGHSLGRAHPDPASDDPATPNVTEGCGHSRSDSGYKYPNAEISPAGGAFMGFDAGDGEFGLAPRLILGAIGHDFMSYCNESWISDYTYNAIYTRLMGAAASAAGATAASSEALVRGLYRPAAGLAVPVLSLSGVILPDDGEAFIQHLRRSESDAVAPVAPGDYAVRLLDAGGAALGETPFAGDAIEDAPEPALSFGLTVDFVAGTRRVQIVRLSDGAVLAEALISASPPVVSGVSVVGATDPLSGTVTVSWTASDPDGDELTFDLLYSMDGGGTFQPLSYGLSGTSAPVDTALLGGTSGAVFRVIASDGANTALADSAPAAVAAKAPQVAITLPADNLHVQWAQLVNFAGEAFDLQDGSLDGFSLEWWLNGALLEYGSLYSSDTLPVGTNLLTLKATNSAGLSAEATVTVVVGDDLNLPGPILSVAPEAVSWHVGAGETALQTAELTVANLGGGSLTWTASSSAAWLTLSAAAGSAPEALTLTADPSGVAAGTTAQAEVTITSPETGTSVVIPVSLGVGDVWAGSPASPKQIWLPLVKK